MTAFQIEYRTILPRELPRLRERRRAIFPERGSEPSDAEDRARINNDRGEFLFICREDVEAGYLYLQELPEGDVPFCLEELFLLPEHRREGIGRLVLGYVLEVCRAWGHQRLRCRVAPRDTESAAFFRAMGGEEVPSEDGLSFYFTVPEE